MAVKFENYETRATPKKISGINLYWLKDNKWGTDGCFAEFNPDFDVHAGNAWVGAQTSRSQDDYETLFRKVAEASAIGAKTAGSKLSEVFVGYGHASVGDMAPVMLFFNNIAMHLAYRLFNDTSTGAGQELSTRYVNIDDFGLPPLEVLLGTKRIPAGLKAQYRDIQRDMAQTYTGWVGTLSDTLNDYLLRTYTGEFKQSSVTSRSLDSARMFLPFGTKTNLTFLGSVRNWIDISAQLATSGDQQGEALGEHILALLSLDQHPEIGDVKAELGALTRHSEGSDQTSRAAKQVANLAIDIAGDHLIEDYDRTSVGPSASRVKSLDHPKFRHPGQKLVASYMLSQFPNVPLWRIQEVVVELTDNQLGKMGEIIFEGHTHHDLMRQQADLRGDAIVYDSALAFDRDANRQRALGRMATLFTSNDTWAHFNRGWNDNYAMQSAEYWAPYRNAWHKDMDRIYNKLGAFLEKVQDHYPPEIVHSMFLNLIPLGHQTTMVLSGPPSQWNYATSLRIGLGGDFGYRDDFWNMLELLRKSDPVYASMSGHLEKPDINDPYQIVGRS